MYRAVSSVGSSVHNAAAAGERTLILNHDGLTSIYIGGNAISRNIIPIKLNFPCTGGGGKQGYHIDDQSTYSR